MKLEKHPLTSTYDLRKDLENILNLKIPMKVVTEHMLDLYNYNGNEYERMFCPEDLRKYYSAMGVYKGLRQYAEMGGWEYEGARDFYFDKVVVRAKQAFSCVRRNFNNKIIISPKFYVGHFSKRKRQKYM